MTLRLQAVTAAFGPRNVLQGVSAEIVPGQFACLLGVNGAGKTTLLRVLAGQLPPGSGGVMLNGASARPDALAATCAILPQGVTDPPHLTVAEVVALGRYPYRRGLARTADASERAIVDRCLERCRADPFAQRPLESLSSGEKRRAWLAFCLAQQKPFLLLDESLDALDFLAKREFFAFLATLAAEGGGVLLTTHDLGLALEFARRVLVLRDGRIAYDGPPREDLPRLLAEPP